MFVTGVITHPSLSSCLLYSTRLHPFRTDYSRVGPAMSDGLWLGRGNSFIFRVPVFYCRTSFRANKQLVLVQGPRQNEERASSLRLQTLRLIRTLTLRTRTPASGELTRLGLVCWSAPYQP
jgi:hypothetical protein